MAQSKVFKTKAQAVKYRKQLYKSGNPSYTYQMADGKYKIYAYPKKPKTTKRTSKIKTKTPKRIVKTKVSKRTKIPIRRVTQVSKRELTNSEIENFYQENRTKAFPKRYGQTEAAVEKIFDNYDDLFWKKYKRQMTNRESAELEDGIWNGVF